MKKYLLFLVALALISLTHIQKECFVYSSLPTIPDFVIGQEFGNLGHRGVDYSVSVGTNIYADLDGIVIVEEDNARVYGRYLMIMHPDGYASLYAHLSAFKVKTGEKVYSGQLIALSGGDPNDDIDGDGWSSGAHLHFEVREKDYIYNVLYTVDPIKYLESIYAQCSLER